MTAEDALAAQQHREQPPPVPNGGPSMHDLVCAELQKRKHLGLNRYGSLLQAGNGRDALRDALEEALDLAVYLMQVIAERDTTDVARLRAQHVAVLALHVSRDVAWCAECPTEPWPCATARALGVDE